jgi:hypothetical protein
MTHEQNEKILSLIQKSREVRKQALSEEDISSSGYPYLTGYLTSTLDAIEETLLSGES